MSRTWSEVKQMSLLQMSFVGAVMILAIIVIRALTINLLPKKTFVVLWGIAVVRLLLPLSLPSVFSVYSLLSEYTSVIDAAKGSQAVLALQTETPGQITIMHNNLSSTANTVSMWTVIWAIGMLISAMVFAIVYWKCQQEFQTSLPVNNDFIIKWLNTHQQKRTISIRQSSRFSAPLTYGILRPVILVPTSTEWENTASLQYVLEHEYVHIRRFDSIKKFALIIVLCVHWFNPLVWAMYILANRDIELSCDEAVVRLFGENKKATYARVLISMEETRNGLTPLCNNFSKNAIEERINAIMKIKKNTISSLILASFIVVGTMTAFATSANAQPQQAESVEQNKGIEIVSKPDHLPQIADNFGVFFKEGGTPANIDTDNVQTAVPVQTGDIHGAPIEKTEVSETNLPKNNIIYFDTEAERDEHFRALEANVEKGLDRYAGFENMYVDIDTSRPITYIVK